MAKHKKIADLNGSFADVLEEDQFYVAIFLPMQGNLNLKDL